MSVFDASAILAFVQDESGAERVSDALDGGVIGAANWAEVAQKIQSSGMNWRILRTVLLSYELRIEPVTVADAEHAAASWQRGSGLSLADRLCLALTDRLDDVVLTADRAWGESERVVQIR